jgi:hypothetical protein
VGTRYGPPTIIEVISRMDRVCLVSCVSSKRDTTSIARELYTSPLFVGASKFARNRFDRWFILSARHGLLSPEDLVEPYNQTLKSMPQGKRLSWAKLVLKQLRSHLSGEESLCFLAGNSYREYLLDPLIDIGCKVSVPLEGLSIGRQLQWYKKLKDESARLRDLDRFYQLLRDLEQALGGKRVLRDCTGSLNWPGMGVYYFFQDREERTTRPPDARVVRVGTHTVSLGSKSTLWNRLRTHRGGIDLSGNHRGSIFRLHVGAALLRRDSAAWASSTWGCGQSAPADVRLAEQSIEKEVSRYIGAMQLLWLPVGDAAGPSSDRAYIERNSIALLAGHSGPMDIPSVTWLGHASPRAEIQSSGLWNINYVTDLYDKEFLNIFEEYVVRARAGAPPSLKSLAPRDWLKRVKFKSPPQVQLPLFGNE